MGKYKVGVIYRVFQWGVEFVIDFNKCKWNRYMLILRFKISIMIFGTLHIENKVVLIEISKQRHKNKEVSTMKYEMSGKI